MRFGVFRFTVGPGRIIAGNGYRIGFIKRERFCCSSRTASTHHYHAGVHRLGHADEIVAEVNLRLLCVGANGGLAIIHPG